MKNALLPRLPRLPLLLLLAPLAVGAPGVASADVIAVRSVPPAKLPGELDLPRSSAPEHLAATDKLEGFYPAAPSAETLKHLKEHGGWRYTYVFSNEAQAKAYSAGAGSDAPEGHAGPARTCFTTGSYRSAKLSFSTYVQPPPPKVGSKEWLAEQKKKAEATLAALKQHKPTTTTAAKPATPPAKPSTVRALRSERFAVGEGGGATLEVVDVWLDTETLGVRLASRASVPFARVATGPSSLEIFAARDNGQVNFFITPPKAPAQEGPVPSGLRSIANRVFAQLPSGSTTSSSECGYMRIALQSAPGSGQMASVVANAFLQPAPEDAADLPTGAAGDEEERRIAGMTTHTVRTRPVIANLSISQLTTEADPTLSITFAWAGQDQQRRF